MASRLRKSSNILRYLPQKAHASTLRRQYLQWRSEQDPPLPVRCDNVKCKFHAEPLIWNGVPFEPILDHVEGVNSDNRPEKLRLLCPNCDSQQTTRGGRNKGRVTKSSGGFAVVGMDGKKKYTLPVETGYFNFSTLMELKMAQGFMNAYENFERSEFPIIPFFLCRCVIQHSLRSLHLKTIQLNEVVENFGAELEKSYLALPKQYRILATSEVAVLRTVDELHGFDYVDPIVPAHGYTALPPLNVLQKIARKILRLAEKEREK